MWVRRGTIYVKPGYIAEAIAHTKSISPPKGMAVRMLRPYTGAEAATKLIFEFAFEDPDARAAGYGKPGQADEWMRRWIELNQSRGEYELFQVRHERPAQGSPGKWIDRRTRFYNRGTVEQAVALFSDALALSVPGYAMRVLEPRTPQSAVDYLVVESSFDSLPAFDAALSSYLDTPEGKAFGKSVWALEPRRPVKELLRVVN